MGGVDHELKRGLRCPRALLARLLASWIRPARVCGVLAQNEAMHRAGRRHHRPKTNEDISTKAAIAIEEDGIACKALISISTWTTPLGKKTKV